MQYGGVSGDEVWSDQPLKTYTSDTKIRKSFRCYFYQSARTGKYKGKDHSLFVTLRFCNCKSKHGYSSDFHARNSSWPLAIFQPVSTFGRPKSILVGQIYCTVSTGQLSITYKMSGFQKNSRPISDSYFYLV